MQTFRTALAGLVVAALVLAGGAAAHASLESSSPRAGEAVERAPERATVHLSESVDPKFSGVRVENAHGQRIDRGDVLVEDRTMSVGLPTLPRGVYVVRWHALSNADGHTTRGSVPFAVGEASQLLRYEEAAAEETETGGPLESAARGAGFVGIALVVGSLGYRRFVLPRLDVSADERSRARRGAERAVLAGAALVVLGSVVLFLTTADRAVPGAGWSERWDFLLSARTGQLVGARALLGLALVGLAATGAGVTLAQPALALLLVGTVSAASHASALPERAALFATLDAAHVVLGSLWVGGVLHLGLLAWRRAAPTTDLLRVFNPYATALVVLLVATGVTGLLALADPRELRGSDYGRLLLLKLALVAGMLALGGLNGFVLRPLATRRPVDGVLRASLGGELALGLAVLAVVGMLTSASPPYAVAEAPPRPDVLRLDGRADNLTLELVVAPRPLVVGLQRFDLLVREPVGGDHSILNVTLEAYKPTDRRAGDVATEMEIVSHGEHYAAEGALLSAPGEWKVEIKFRRANAYDVKSVFTVQVQEPEVSE